MKATGTYFESCHIEATMNEKEVLAFVAILSESRAWRIQEDGCETPHHAYVRTTMFEAAMMSLVAIEKARKTHEAIK